jgi:hypothetical protein
LPFPWTVQTRERFHISTIKAAHDRHCGWHLPVSDQSTIVHEAHSGFADQANSDGTATVYIEGSASSQQW